MAAWSWGPRTLKPKNRGVYRRIFKRYFGAVGNVPNRPWAVNFARAELNLSGQAARRAFPAFVYPLPTGNSQEIRGPRERGEVRRARGSVDSEIEPKGIESWLGSGGLKERVALDGGTGWGFGRQAQMGEDLHNHSGFFDGGDELHRAATLQTGGYLVTKDQVAQIKIGSSSREDVRIVLGDPMAVSQPTDSGNAPKRWVYPLSKYASDPNTGIPPIGVVGAPISRGRRKTTEVGIGFDGNGIVNSIKERRPPQ